MMMPSLGLGLIGDGLRRAQGDTGHTVRTASIPDGPALSDADIIERALFRAFTAGDAAVGYVKPFIAYEERVEEGVYRAAFQPVSQGYGRPF